MNNLRFLFMAASFIVGFLMGLILSLLPALVPTLSEEVGYILLVFIILLYIPLTMVNLAKEGFFGFFDFPNILEKISLKYLIILVLYFVTPILLDAILNTTLNPTLYFTIFISYTIYFLFGVMFDRAVTKYYLERENETIKR